MKSWNRIKLYFYSFKIKAAGKKVLSYFIFIGAGLSGVAVALFVSTILLAPSESAQNRNSNNTNQPEATATTNGGDSDLLRDNFVAEVQSYLEPFIYDPKGRRDPFGPYVDAPTNDGEGFQGPLLPLQRFDIAELKLIGIMWDVIDPKAMFVDPNQQVHTVGKDERIGRNNGYIAVIREGEVVVVEATRRKGDLVYSSIVVRLNQ